MFYVSQPSENVRLGDVIGAYVPSIDEPLQISIKNRINIEIGLHTLCVVLTPCCQIKKCNEILLSPLQHIQSKFLDNEKIRSDFSRINRLMEQRDQIHQRLLEAPDEDLRIRLTQPPSWAFRSNFVYLHHDLFQEYIVSNKNMGMKTKSHIIDFNNIFSIKKPPIEKIVSRKICELSIEVRNDLREKLSQYFGDVPVEDAAIEML
jgi:hypothetical protein